MISFKFELNQNMVWYGIAYIIEMSYTIENKGVVDHGGQVANVVTEHNQ